MQGKKKTGFFLTHMFWLNKYIVHCATQSIIRNDKFTLNFGAKENTEVILLDSEST